MNGFVSRIVGIALATSLLAGVAGCGALNVSDLVTGTVNATAASLFDVFLTDVANQLADSLE